MKNLFTLLFIALSIIGCKETTDQNDQSTEEKTEAKKEPTLSEKIATAKENMAEGQKLLIGDFIYYGDAAVLSTNNGIYAVKIDERMHALNEQSKEYKKEDHSMTRVVVTAETMPNPMFVETGEGWEEMIKIDQIIDVKAAEKTPVIDSRKQEI